MLLFNNVTYALFTSYSSNSTTSPALHTQYRLAKDLSVKPLRISEIVRSKRGITADTALRLGRYFGLSAAYWMNLQALYEIEIAEDFLEDRLKEEVTPREEVAA